MEHGRIHQHKLREAHPATSGHPHPRTATWAQPATRTLAVNSAEFGSLLPAWSTLDAGKGTYSALYPYGRIDYTDPVPSTSVSTTFWSPIVAGNDESSSQPVAYFDVELSNKTKKTTNVSTMFTFPNAPAHVGSTVQNTPSKVPSVRTGYTSRATVDHRHKITGITLGADSPTNTADAKNSEWTTAVRDEPGRRVSYATSWNADGDGSDIYTPFKTTGRLPNASLDSSNSASALSVEMKLKAHQTETVRFVLAWDFPQITFGTAGDTSWMRRYTSFYGAREDAKNNYITGSYPGHQGFAIAARNLLRADKSAKDVARWWKPVAADTTVSPAIRMAALNELGQLPFNGSFWESGWSPVPTTQAHLGQARRSLARTCSTHSPAVAGPSRRNRRPGADGDRPAGAVPLYRSRLGPRDLRDDRQDPNGRVPGSPGFNPPVDGYIWWQLSAPWLLWETSTSPAVPETTFFDRPAKYLIRAYGGVPQLRRRFTVARHLPGDAPGLDPRCPPSDTAGRHAAHGAGYLRQHLRRDGPVGECSRGLQLRPVHPGHEIMQAATKDAKRLGIPAASTVDVAALKQRGPRHVPRTRRRSGPEATTSSPTQAPDPPTPSSTCCGPSTWPSSSDCPTSIRPHGWPIT